jgi:hypothetical protein
LQITLWCMITGGAFLMELFSIHIKEGIMQTQTLESSLDNELLEGEEVLWSGRPDPRRRRIVFPTRVFFILGLIFMPVGLLIVLVGLVLLLISVFPPEARLSLLGVFIPGGVFFLLGIIYFLIGIAGFSPPRNVLYAITNRRVIILRPGRYLRASSYPTARALLHRCSASSAATVPAISSLPPFLLTAALAGTGRMLASPAPSVRGSFPRSRMCARLSKY